MSLLRNTNDACKAIPKQNYENYRYLNKGNNPNERGLFQIYWDELIGRYGTNVEYYVYNYSTALTGHDFLYGEQPTASFATPVNVVMMADLQSEAILLSKFGIDTNADIILVVTMADYARIFGENAEPKSGDVIRLTELGWDVNEVTGYGSDTQPVSTDVLNELCMYKDPDNPASIVYPPTANRDGDPISGSDVWVRCPQLFEITERRHQDFSMQVNTLLGHYVWVIKGKRFDYSYQPGIDPECKMGDVGEETRTGLLSGYTQDPSAPKDYPGNIQDESNGIWDYAEGDEARNDSVYGEY